MTHRTTQATKTFYDGQDAMLQLWCHEAFRIIGDGMWDTADRTWLRGQLDDQLKAIFGPSWHKVLEKGTDCSPLFSFMQSTEKPLYEPVTDFAVLKVFDVTVDQSVADVSKQMLQEPKCRNCMTPTNCLERVRGYRGTSRESPGQEVGHSADKLKRGLQKEGGQKLQERGEQGPTMQVICQDKKVVVAEGKPRRELLLGAIVQDKRIADEQQRQDVQVQRPPGLPLPPRMVSRASSRSPAASEGLLASQQPKKQSQQEDKEPQQCTHMRDAWGVAAPPVPQPKYPARGSRCRNSSKDADARVRARCPPTMPQPPGIVSQAGSTSPSSCQGLAASQQQPTEHPQEQRRQPAALQGQSPLYGQELPPAKQGLLGRSKQARLPAEAGTDTPQGGSWDASDDDSPDGWAIHTWDALPSGSSEQHVQAEPDAQAASALGVEPPPHFSHSLPQLPHQALSHPGPEGNPQQQLLPAMVPPPPGLGIALVLQQQQAVAAAPPPPQQQQAVAAAPPPPQQQQAVAAAPPPPQQQQQQAVAAAPPLPQQQQQAVAAAPPPPQQQQQQAMTAAPARPQQHAAQGQPAQQGRQRRAKVEMCGDYFLTNPPVMRRLRQLRQQSSVNFVDWGRVDPQREAELARQQQEEEAETARFCLLDWSHDGFKSMHDAWGDGAPPVPEPRRF